MNTNSKEHRANEDMVWGFSVIVRLIGGFLLFLAIGDLPYKYYEMLRIVICASSLYLVWYFYFYHKKEAGWLFALPAILFNPISPIYLEKSTWVTFDILLALIFGVSILIEWWLRYSDEKYEEIMSDPERKKKEEIFSALRVGPTPPLVHLIKYTEDGIDRGILTEKDLKFIKQYKGHRHRLEDESQFFELQAILYYGLGNVPTSESMLSMALSSDKHDRFVSNFGKSWEKKNRVVK